MSGLVHLRNRCGHHIDFQVKEQVDEYPLSEKVERRGSNQFSEVYKIQFLADKHNV